jgi:hypothetical protein
MLNSIDWTSFRSSHDEKNDTGGGGGAREREEL